MGVKYKRGWCRGCQDWRRGEKRTPTGIFHFIMILLTFGMWSFIWSFSVIELGMRRYDCPVCGGKKWSARAQRVRSEPNVPAPAPDPSFSEGPIRPQW